MLVLGGVGHLYAPSPFSCTILQRDHDHICNALALMGVEGGPGLLQAVVHG